MGFLSHPNFQNGAHDTERAWTRSTSRQKMHWEDSPQASVVPSRLCGGNAPAMCAGLCTIFGFDLYLSSCPQQRHWKLNESGYVFGPNNSGGHCSRGPSGLSQGDLDLPMLPAGYLWAQAADLRLHSESWEAPWQKNRSEGKDRDRTVQT